METNQKRRVMKILKYLLYVVIGTAFAIVLFEGIRSTDIFILKVIVGIFFIDDIIATVCAFILIIALLRRK